MSHICDCGIRYSNLDALMACQNSNHGNPRYGEKATRNAVIEECARICDGMAYVELCANDGPQGSAAARPYQKAATTIRALKEKSCAF